MKKHISYFVLSIFIIDTIIIATIYYNSDILVDIKYALFTDYISKEHFNSPPSRFVDNGFKIDTDPTNTQWFKDNRLEVIRLVNTSLNKQYFSDIEKAKSIASLYSDDSGEYCSNDDNLISKLNAVSRDKKGCCVDYSELFMFFSNLTGLFSREVHTDVHVTNEFYSNNLKRWIWIDTQHMLIAKDSNSNYLSLFDIRTHYLRNEKVSYEFIGTNNHYLFNKNPYEFEYYDDPNDFSHIMITNGSNVIGEYEFRERFSILPKGILQFIGLIAGKIPSFLILDDEYSSRTHWENNRGLFIILLSLFSIGNILAGLKLYLWLRDRYF